jgi:hypothetical protein
MFRVGRQVSDTVPKESASGVGHVTWDQVRVHQGCQRPIERFVCDLHAIAFEPVCNLLPGERDRQGTGFHLLRDHVCLLLVLSGKWKKEAGGANTRHG